MVFICLTVFTVVKLSLSLIALGPILIHLPMQTRSSSMGRRSARYRLKKSKSTSRKIFARHHPHFTSAHGLLPGEKLHSRTPCGFYLGTCCTLRGHLIITNYRLRFVTSEPNAHWYTEPSYLYARQGAPLSSVGRVSVSRSKPTIVKVLFKDLRTWQLVGETAPLKRIIISETLLSSPTKLFAFLQPRETPYTAEHHVYAPFSDLRRMGVDPTSYGSPFRYTSLNGDFSLCPSYPRVLAVPSAMSDMEISSVAGYRSKGRLPVLRWAHPNSASIWRCAQPRRGIFNRINPIDDRMLQAIWGTNATSANLWIVDCRAKVNAFANNVRDSLISLTYREIAHGRRH
jgi:hypothetical protein